MLSYKIFDKHPRLGGSLLADWSSQHIGLTIETTQRGFGACSATIRLPAHTARWWFGQLDGEDRHVTDNGMVVYEGRIELVETVAEGLALTAFGYSRAYSDMVVSDMWSDMQTTSWQAIETVQAGNRIPDRYALDTNNRLYFAPNSGEAHSLNAIASMYIAIPDLSSRQFSAIEFSYKLVAPAGWTASLTRYTNTFGFLSTIWALNGTGVLQTSTPTYSGLSGSNVLAFSLYRNQAAATLNAAILAGTRTITPSSMTGIKKGTELAISGGDPEDVEVTAVTATTFTATFKYDHAAADTCVPVFEGETGDIYLEITNLRVKTTSSAAVYADEVAKYLISQVSAANSTQANNLNHRIKSPGFDLKQYSYDSVKAEEVLDQLAQLGGDGWLWSWRVWRDQILIFDRIANGGQTYQLYWQTPPISRDLGLLTTRLKPRYTNANGDEQVAADVINATAERKYGIVRSEYFDAPTTSASDATALAQAALNDKSIVNAYGDVATTALHQNGVRVPLWSVRSGDTIQCIQFPTTGNSDTDKTRQFRVAVTKYDHDNRTLTISPEQRQPTIDSLLARRDVSLVGK